MAKKGGIAGIAILVGALLLAWWAVKWLYAKVAGASPTGPAVDKASGKLILPDDLLAKLKAQTATAADVLTLPTDIARVVALEAWLYGINMLSDPDGQSNYWTQLANGVLQKATPGWNSSPGGVPIDGLSAKKAYAKQTFADVLGPGKLPGIWKIAGVV